MLLQGLVHGIPHQGLQLACVDSDLTHALSLPPVQAADSDREAIRIRDLVYARSTKWSAWSWGGGIVRAPPLP